ncbi:cytidine deaminase [Patescibacteria group bacterium]|nr:cytidine deaminase [Patescibacteria group bacterium]MBU4098357.1 cytidine deaminase [Patescibacteria group bacterium]
MIAEEEIKKLRETASIARSNAFVPRSDHKIGSSILSTDGKYFGGCNIESNISGLGSCSERVAIDNAICNGKYGFKALLILDDKLTVPCGACLQYLLEFYVITNQDIIIISSDIEGNIKNYSLLELLPNGYFPDHDIEKIKSYKNK